MKTTQSAKGIIFASLAAIAYGIMPLFTEISMSRGMSTEYALFYRSLFTVVSAGLFLFFSKRSLRISKKQGFAVFIYFGIFFSLTNYFLTAAYSLIPTGLATMFHFTFPLLTTIGCVIVFKDRLTKAKMFAISSAVASLLFLADLSGTLRVKGILFAVLSAVFCAVYMMGNRTEAMASVDPFVLIFYGSLISTVLFGVCAVPAQGIDLPTHPAELIGLLMTGVVSTFLALAMNTVAIRCIGPSKTSILNMLEPVTSLLCGVLFLRESLQTRSIIGCVFIIASAAIEAFVPSDD